MASVPSRTPARQGGGAASLAYRGVVRRDLKAPHAGFTRSALNTARRLERCGARGSLGVRQLSQLSQLSRLCIEVVKRRHAAVGEPGHVWTGCLVDVSPPGLSLLTNTPERSAAFTRVPQVAFPAEGQPTGSTKFKDSRRPSVGNCCRPVCERVQLPFVVSVRIRSMAAPLDVLDSIPVAGR